MGKGELGNNCEYLIFHDFWVISNEPITPSNQLSPVLSPTLRPGAPLRDTEPQTLCDKPQEIACR